MTAQLLTMAGYRPHHSSTSSSSSSAASSSAASSSSVFPIKLYHLLNQASKGNYEDVVCWEPDGKSFKVHDKDRFTSEIMPMYFGGTSNYRSFQKNLNMWGFTMNERKGRVAHELFCRDSGESKVHLMKRRHVVKRRKENPPQGGSTASNIKESVAAQIAALKNHPGQRDGSGNGRASSVHKSNNTANTQPAFNLNSLAGSFSAVSSPRLSLPFATTVGAGVTGSSPSFEDIVSLSSALRGLPMAGGSSAQQLRNHSMIGGNVGAGNAAAAAAAILTAARAGGPPSPSSSATTTPLPSSLTATADILLGNAARRPSHTTASLGGLTAAGGIPDVAAALAYNAATQHAAVAAASAAASGTNATTTTANNVNTTTMTATDLLEAASKRLLLSQIQEQSKEIIRKEIDNELSNLMNIQQQLLGSRNHNTPNNTNNNSTQTHHHR